VVGVHVCFRLLKQEKSVVFGIEGENGILECVDDVSGGLRLGLFIFFFTFDLQHELPFAVVAWLQQSLPVLRALGSFRSNKTRNYRILITAIFWCGSLMQC